MDVEDCRSLVLLPRWIQKTKLLETGCIVWTASGTKNGYGRISLNNKKTLVHRIAWVAANGVDIPLGMQIDHLCRVRGCVLPDHLEIVTPKENTHRGESFAAVLGAREFCKRGHRYVSVDRPSTHKRRVCKECMERSWILVRDAAAVLGMSATKYISIYGASYRKAEVILGIDPSD